MNVSLSSTLGRITPITLEEPAGGSVSPKFPTQVGKVTIMATPRTFHLQPCSGFLVLLISFLYFSLVASAASTEKRYITITDANGDRRSLEENRRPALYTQDFGDCQGDSLINVTRFDAAYYKDNMTILFHLAGNTALTNESLMCE